MKFPFRKKKKSPYGWFGNYASWNEVSKLGDGYDKAGILEKTAAALTSVKSGMAVYERDSVLLDKRVLPYPLLSHILYTAMIKKAPLNILDFGGSLGTTYFNTKDFLPSCACSNWNIVEQSHYVDFGRKYFQDQILQFYYTIEECMVENTIDVAILSSVIQFLPSPHSFLEKLVGYKFDCLIMDRTFFINAKQDRLTLQKVWPSVYEASYPAWFFNEENFLNHFRKNYEIVADFSSYVPEEGKIEIDNIPVGYSKGFCLKRY